MEASEIILKYMNKAIELNNEKECGMIKTGDLPDDRFHQNKIFREHLNLLITDCELDMYSLFLKYRKV